MLSMTWTVADCPYKQRFDPKQSEELLKKVELSSNVEVSEQLSNTLMEEFVMIYQLKRRLNNIHLLSNFFKLGVRPAIQLLTSSSV